MSAASRDAVLSQSFIRNAGASTTICSFTFPSFGGGLLGSAQRPLLGILSHPGLQVSARAQRCFATGLCGAGPSGTTQQ